MNTFNNNPIIGSKELVEPKICIMAQFVPFASGVEVNGETVLSTVNAFPEFLQAFATKILAEKSIENPQPGSWYSQEAWLESFKIISEKFGANTLFEIGKKIPENAQFPPEVNSIDKGLGAIDVAYNMNHRNGDIGYYKLVSFDEANRTLVMECKNPYPCDFDRGIITAMARKFKPGIEVQVDKSKPSRKDGDDSSWYIITYS